MAFLKFSRDKRGYEHFYLVQPTNRRGKARSRVLYWFRTPPNVKVGRKPFDAEIRRTLETANPDVSFDWAAIAETVIPSADTERWRERRRAKRATGQVAEIDTEDGSGEEQAHVEVERAGVAAPAGVESSVISADEPGPAVAPAATSNPSSSAPDGTPGPGRSGRRRRRRRGRRGPHATSVQVPGSEPSAQGPEVQDSGESENENPEP